MNTTEKSSFSHRQALVKKLIFLSALTIALFVANGVVTLFLLQDQNQSYLDTLRGVRQQMQALESTRTAQVHFKKQVQEWKNILLRGRNQVDFDRYLKAFDDEAAAIQKHLEQLKSTGPDSRTNHIEDLQKQLHNLSSAYHEALTGFDQKRLDSALEVDAKVRGMDRQPTADMDALVEEIKVETDQVVTAIHGRTEQNYVKTRRMVVVVSSVAVLLSLGSLGISLTAARKS